MTNEGGAGIGANGPDYLAGSNQLLEGWGIKGFWSLNGKTQSSVPHQRGKDTQGTGHTKHYCVVVHLCKSVIL